MILRKMEQSEHNSTRRLWEEVFPEDTKAFLDYYYYIKTRDNRIYVIEEDGDIQSMLHLNPYRIRIGEKEFPSAYIIAVATRKAYRRRGYMGALLRSSLAAMYDEKVPFTFLMPAAEAIYLPYDFRFIYTQSIGILTETGEMTEPKVQFQDAGLWDGDEMAAFFSSHFQDRWQVCTVRDPEYYRTMILEQQSERGGVRLMRHDGKLAGMFAYASEDETEIREPLYLDGYEEAFLGEAARLAEGRKAVPEDPASSEKQKIRIYGYVPGENGLGKGIFTEKRDLIMARIVYLPAFLSALKTRSEENLQCSFAVIDPVLTGNSRIWKLESPEGTEEIRVRETEDSEGVIPVAELTELLFGRKTAEEIRQAEGVILSDRLAEELSRILAPAPVCFNEVV